MTPLEWFQLTLALLALSGILWLLVRPAVNFVRLCVATWQEERERDRAEAMDARR